MNVKRKLIVEGIATTEPVILTNVQVVNNITVQEKQVIIKEIMMQSGTANFINAKIAAVAFIRAFEKKPRITLTQNDTSVPNPYVRDVTTTDFTVNFQNNWTGSLDWIALERE